MKLEKTVESARVRLVPYEPQHVPKYNGWMKDQFLQETTASEPLSLEEEYQMQRNWEADQDKFTFLIVDKQRSENSVEGMVGDINIFYHDEEDRTNAEIDVMIAEKDARGKGLGLESVIAMLRFAGEEMGIKSFEVKISFDNEASLHLFRDKLLFEEVSRSDVFEEITLRKVFDPSWIASFNLPYSVQSLSS
eukprot:TRINITY_DN6468_c0_g1_i1.p2 TRINITY_DN6468_c0_g1~~TRINITY_DN6468_c0_g1_i1.p2  ORF type:complete len:192 (-),score=75.09 TRINITY_DN6468_c0_g1_i1:7-582(-)